MQELPCILSSHKSNVWMGTIQSFIYKKRLVCIPHTKQLCGLNYTSLSSFNGARSYFLSDEDFVGSVNSGR